MKPIRLTRFTTLDDVEDPDFYLVDPSKVLAIYRTTNGQSTVIEIWRGQSFHVIEPTAVVIGRIEAALEAEVARLAAAAKEAAKCQ